MTPLCFDLAVSVTPLSHGAWSYTKIFHWLSGVIDTTESWLIGVIGDLKHEYLSELATFFETILSCESEAHIPQYYWWKKPGVQTSRETVPLSSPMTGVQVTRDYAWGRQPLSSHALIYEKRVGRSCGRRRPVGGCLQPRQLRHQHFQTSPPTGGHF